MLSINFNPFPLITTDRLALRQVKDSDVNEIFILRSDIRVMEFIDREPAKSIEEASLFIQKINVSQNNNESILWGITFKGETSLVGTICLWNIEKEHDRAEIGYNLLPDYQGQGIMQEALTEVVNYGFKIMRLHSISADVNPDNVPSIKLLERNKFLREAYFKENVFYNGKFIDSVIYSLLTPI